MRIKVQTPTRPTARRSETKGSVEGEGQGHWTPLPSSPQDKAFQLENTRLRELMAKRGIVDDTEVTTEEPKQNDKGTEESLKNAKAELHNIESINLYRQGQIPHYGTLLLGAKNNVKELQDQLANSKPINIRVKNSQAILKRCQTADDKGVGLLASLQTELETLQAKVDAQVTENDKLQIALKEAQTTFDKLSAEAKRGEATLEQGPTDLSPKSNARHCRMLRQFLQRFPRKSTSQSRARWASTRSSLSRPSWAWQRQCTPCLHQGKPLHHPRPSGRRPFQRTLTSKQERSMERWRKWTGTTWIWTRTSSVLRVWNSVSSTLINCRTLNDEQKSGSTTRTPRGGMQLIQRSSRSTRRTRSKDSVTSRCITLLLILAALLGYRVGEAAYPGPQFGNYDWRNELQHNIVNNKLSWLEWVSHLGEGSLKTMFDKMNSNKSIINTVFQASPAATVELEPDLHIRNSSSASAGKKTIVLLNDLIADVPNNFKDKWNCRLLNYLDKNYAMEDYESSGNAKKFTISNFAAKSRRRGGKGHCNKKIKMNKANGEVRMFFGNITSWSDHASHYVTTADFDVACVAEAHLTKDCMLKELATLKRHGWIGSGAPATRTSELGTSGGCLTLVKSTGTASL